MLKRTNNTRKTGVEGYAAKSVSSVIRLWSSLILFLICATLLCCAFLMSGRISNAAVKPNDSSSGTAITYSVTNGSDGNPIRKLYRNPTNKNANSNISYALLSDADTVNQMSLTGGGTVGEVSLDPTAKTVTLIKNKDQRTGSSDYYHQVCAYMAFNAQITVPAHTEYTIDFSYKITTIRYVSNANSTTLVGAEFLYFGNDYDDPAAKDMSESLAFSYTSTEPTESAQYRLVHKYYNAKASSGTTYTITPETAGATAVPTITMTNSSNSPKTYTAYFGLYSYGSSGTDYYNWYTNTLAMEDTLTVTATDVPTVDKTQAVYNPAGNVFTFDYDSTCLDYTISYKDIGGIVSDVTGNVTINTDGTCTLTDVGVYTFTFKIKDNCGAVWDGDTNDQTDKTLTVEIVKKELDIEFENKDGFIVAKFKDETQIYAQDKYDNGRPKFTLTTKYSKNGAVDKATYTRPDSAGVWYAHAFVDDDCGYSVDNSGEQFTLSKIKLAYPSAADPDALTQIYNGAEHEILLVNYVSSAMTYVVPQDTQINYDVITGDLTVKIKKTGEYTVKFSLINTALYEWVSDEPVKITVSPKKVQINADEGNPVSWEKDGSTKDLKFTVPTALCEGDSSLNLVAVCTKNSIGQKPVPAVSYADGIYTVTVPAYSRGNYSLVVKVADGENYSGSSQPVTFEITGVGIDLDYNDIVWKIDGKNYTVASENDAAEIVYSGKTFTVTADFSANQYAADLEIVGAIGGDWADAVDRGEYTATVRIASTNPELVFDKEFTLKISIVPKELTFDDAQWQWQYEGDTEWKALTDMNMPGFDNKTVSVRLSPDYLEGLGLKDGDYYLNYINNNDMTEKGDKTTSVEITVTNNNFSAGQNGYIEITKNWKIGAKVVKYSWTATQTIGTDSRSFEFPAIAFEDGNDYSQYFEYYFTVDGEGETEYSREQLEEYISLNWTETSAVSGKVFVRATTADGEVTIEEDFRSFTTGTPKTALSVSISVNDCEYGEAGILLSVTRGSSDESARTIVTVSGGNLEEDKTFEGNSEDLAEFIRGLGAGSYTIKVSVNSESEGAYTLTGDSEASFEISKRKVALPALKEVTYTGGTIYFKDCIEGFDESTMKILGAEDNGIDSGREWREDGYYTKIALLDSDNYEFAETDGAAEYEYNWMINKFRITDDMWNKDGKEGAVLDLPQWVKDMLGNPETLSLAYSYFNDEHGEALEEVLFTEGSSFYVSAILSGSEADNFEFENGTSADGVKISGKTVYSVPESSGAGKFFGSVGKFVKDNLGVVIGVGIGLLLLLALIIILARRRRYADTDEYDDEYDYDEYDYDEDDEDDEYDYDDYDEDDYNEDDEY